MYSLFTPLPGDMVPPAGPSALRSAPPPPTEPGHDTEARPAPPLPARPLCLPDPPRRLNPEPRPDGAGAGGDEGAEGAGGQAQGRGGVPGRPARRRLSLRRGPEKRGGVRARGSGGGRGGLAARAGGRPQRAVRRSEPERREAGTGGGRSAGRRRGARERVASGRRSALPSEACAQEGGPAYLLPAAPACLRPSPAAPARPRAWRSSSAPARAFLPSKMSPMARRPAFLRQPAREGAASVPGADASPRAAGPRPSAPLRGRPLPWDRKVRGGGGVGQAGAPGLGPGPARPCEAPATHVPVGAVRGTRHCKRRHLGSGVVPQSGELGSPHARHSLIPSRHPWAGLVCWKQPQVHTLALAAFLSPFTTAVTLALTPFSFLVQFLSCPHPKYFLNLIKSANPPSQSAPKTLIVSCIVRKYTMLPWLSLQFQKWPHTDSSPLLKGDLIHALQKDVKEKKLLKIETAAEKQAWAMSELPCSSFHRDFHCFCRLVLPPPPP